MPADVRPPAEAGVVTEPELRPLALVTGASRGNRGGRGPGPGPRATTCCSAAGTPRRCRPLAAELPGSRPWPVELTDGVAVAEAVGGIERLDVLVHSAGIGVLGSIAETTAGTWRRQFEINVVAVAELTRLLLPALRAARGRVVLLNSGAGLAARPGLGRLRGEQVRAARLRRRAARRGGGQRGAGHVDPPGAGGHRDAARRWWPTRAASTSPASYLRPESVAGAVLFAVSAPDDAALTELVLRPAGADRGRRARTAEWRPDQRTRRLFSAACSIRSRWTSTSSAPRWTTAPPGTSWWIDPATGRIRSHLADVGGPGTDELADAGWRRIRRTESYESYRDMAEFVAAVHHRRAADLLDRAITGRGAFRRFKDTLFEFPELRDQWFRFRERPVPAPGAALAGRRGAGRAGGRGAGGRPSPRPGAAPRRTCRPRSPSTWPCSTATGCGRCCCSAPGREARAPASSTCSCSWC